jgi:hypothetical protein
MTKSTTDDDYFTFDENSSAGSFVLLPAVDTNLKVTVSSNAAAAETPSSNSSYTDFGITYTVYMDV